jgi:hypothetical protein
MTEKAGPKQARGRFRPGQSGNPAGKPVGARHKITLLAEKLMQADAEAIVKAVTAAAKGGDIAACRLVLDRISPVARERAVKFTLPAVESAADAAKVSGSVLRAVAAGELTPGEAESVTKIIETHIRAIEAVSFEARLLTLELRAFQ